MTTAKKDDLEKKTPSYFHNPFFSFRYSYKSISHSGGRSHVKSVEQRFENGKFETEEFEGTTHGNMYDDVISKMQKYYIDQISALLKPWF
jgi:hypothetical protein